MCSNRETKDKYDNFTEIRIFENLKTITVGQVFKSQVTCILCRLKQLQ